MAFQGIFMMRTAVIIPSRGFASLASKQTLVFKNGLPPAPSQIRHISIKNPKLGGSWGGVVGFGAAAGFGLAMLNIIYQKKEAEKAYQVSFIIGFS